MSAAPVDDPWLGRELDGRYRVVRRLGGGGMGAVYIARQLAIGREVAIKVVQPELIGDRAAVRRFLHEVAIAARLHSPHTITVFDFGEAPDGALYLVTELVPGRDLSAELRATGSMTPLRACRLGLGICDGLAAIHAAGVIHRDLKPSNVLVVPGPGGRELVKVIDFGIARSPQLSAVTASGDVIGTPSYVAPEAIRGEPADARTDLYALGCVLFALVRGRPPFTADGGPVLDQHLRAPAPPLTEAGPLAAVVARLLSKERTGRYPDALAVREALEACEVALRGAAVPDASARGARRAWPLVVALGGLVLAGGAALWRPWQGGGRAGGLASPDAVAPVMVVDAPSVDAAVVDAVVAVPSVDAGVVDAVVVVPSVDAGVVDAVMPEDGPRASERRRSDASPPGDAAPRAVAPTMVPVDAAARPPVDAAARPPAATSPPVDARLRRTEFLEP